MRPLFFALHLLNKIQIANCNCFRPLCVSHCQLISAVWGARAIYRFAQRRTRQRRSLEEVKPKVEFRFRKILFRAVAYSFEKRLDRVKKVKGKDTTPSSRL